MAGIGLKRIVFVFCALSCLHSALGQVTSIRLVDRTGQVQRSFGRVEVQINNNWGTVCDDEWDNLDAAVICKMAGYDTGGQAFVSAFFGQGTGAILLDNVRCDGSETNINDCVKNNIGVTDCTHAEDAGVNCTVTGSSTPSPPSTTTTLPPVIDQGVCSIPDPNLRLRASAGAPLGMGIVEIRNSSGQWGTICDDDFDVRDAAVVCRALCFATTDPRPGALAQYIASGSAFPIAVDSINCTGTETTLNNCPRSAWGQHDCAPTEVASVTCVQLNSAPRDPPVPRLDCREGYLVAAFNKSYDPNLEPKLLSVADQPNCTDATKQDADSFVTIKIPFTACGTQIRQNATHLMYSNTIKYDHTSYEGPLTRVNTFRIGVTCEMNRGKNITREEVPLTAAVTQKAPGEFVITMKFYRNDSFTVEDTQNPLRLPIGEWLNVGLEMENVDSKLKLIVPTCRAFPFNNSTSVQYTLFQDNCRNEPSLATFPFNQTKFGFRYQTFMFVNSPSVYIVCDTFVCLASDTTAVCDRSCNSSKPQPATTASPASGRRRRDVTDFAPRHFTVASAPVIVYRLDNTETVIERIGGDGTVLGTTVRVPVTVTEVTSTPTPPSTPPPTPPPTPAPTSTPTSTPKPATSSTPDPGPLQTKPSTTTTTVQTTSASVREATPVTTLQWEWAHGITTAPSRDTTLVTAGTTTAGPAILRDRNSVGAEVLRDPAQSQMMGAGGESIQRETLVLVPVRAASTRVFGSLAVVSLALLSALVLC